MAPTVDDLARSQKDGREGGASDDGDGAGDTLRGGSDGGMTGSVALIVRPAVRSTLEAIECRETSARTAAACGAQRRGQQARAQRVDSRKLVLGVCGLREQAGRQAGSRSGERG